MLNLEEFKKRVSMFDVISSGKVSYRITKVDDKRVYYNRLDAASPKSEENIEIAKLFEYYKGGIYSTTIAKRYGLGGKQSPSTAILRNL